MPSTLMADKKTAPVEEPKTTQELKDVIMERYKAADDWLATKRPYWTEYEDLFHNRLADAVSAGAKSQVFDPILATLTLDRSARVMAQVPTGKVTAISKNDLGSAKLMNLTVDKYIVPNANAQFDFLTKGRMVDLYSNIYGNFFVLVDMDVKPNGMRCPDFWLIPIRDVFPQVGATSVEDSDYIIIRTWKPLSYFESLEGQEGVKNIPEILEKLRGRAGDKEKRDGDDISARENAQYGGTSNSAKNAGFYEVLSMYERDRWVDFCVAAELEFRDRENQNEDGELPVLNKYSIPLLDDFMGMGDFERGKTMQYTANSLWNLYLDGVKVSIFPPVLIDKDKVADGKSLKWSAAAKWLMKNGGAAGAQVMNLTPQGTSTFNNTMTAVKTSLLNMFGTSDTTTTQEQDPGFGKTPQALKMQQSRENARDNVDRFYMEQFMQKLIKKMVNLMVKHGAKAQFRMFEQEIKELAKQYPEVSEMYDEKTGKLTFDPKKNGSIIYDYEVVSGSTFATDEKQQQENLIGLFTQLTQGIQVDPQTQKATSPLIMALEAEGKSVELGEIFTRILTKSGIQDWDKIVRDKNDDPDEILKDAMTKFQNLFTQMGGNNMDIPAQPSEEMMLQQMGGNEMAGAAVMPGAMMEGAALDGGQQQQLSPQTQLY